MQSEGVETAMQSVGQKMTGAKKFVWGLIGIFLVASGVCFYLAKTQFSEPYLTSGAAPQPAGPAHELISFDQQGHLLGVSLKQGRFLVDRFQLDAPAEHAELSAGGDAVQWMIGPDGATLAWLSGVNQVSIQRLGLAGQAPRWLAAKTLTAPSDLVTFGLLQDGSLGLILAKGELVKRDPEGKSEDVRETLGGRVTWAQIHGDYAGVVMGDKIRIYRSSKNAWKMIEERPDFAAGSDRRLPADGQIVAIISAGIRRGEETLNTPGKVADVAMTDQGFLLASGDFSGIYSLPASHEPELLAESPAGVQIAAGRAALGFTSAAGTVMLPLKEGERLTETGRLIVAIATALVVLAIVASLLLLFIDGKGLEPSIKRKDSSLKDVKLPKPPPDLIHAISSGRATLWAGAGLSSTSGFPLRNAFISSVFQTALFENWYTAAQMDPYWKLVTDGKQEAALDRFLAQHPANRIRVNDLARSTYSRFATVNPTQKLLGKLPFNTAITTNYDTLLERCGAEWGLNTAGVAGGERVLALGSHLTVRLYGDFEANGAGLAVLGRQELRSALDGNPEFVARFGDLFESRPILFIGACLEGLLEDLALLQVSRPVGIKHYCVAGVASLNWKPRANELKSRYNIEVFPCDVLSIQEQLKVFLSELNEAVAAESPQTEAQAGQPVSG